jgi:uroporphyrinogen decarboxylase
MLNLGYRERFKMCMNHQDTDRVPTDLWLDSNDPNVKSNLLKYTGFDRYEKLLNYLDIDIYRFKPAVRKNNENIEDEFIKFFIPNTDKKYLTLSSEFPRPLINLEDPEKLEQFQWPTADIFDYSSVEPVLDEQKHRVLWVQPGSWSPIFCRMCDLAGMEKVLMDMILNPALTEATIEKIFVFYYDVFQKTLEATKGRLDVFSFGDDYASQIDMMFDLRLWKKYFKGPMKKLCELIKSYGVLISFHSCGAINKLMPDLIDLGIDIIFPIQPKAKGMDAEHLKKEYGNDIVFYGGIDIQEIMPYGTEQEVRSEVSRVTQILGKGGGYILASGHSILEDVPQANVIAMYDEVRRMAFR